jgi:hypothetical protein
MTLSSSAQTQPKLGAVPCALRLRRPPLTGVCGFFPGDVPSPPRPASLVDSSAMSVSRVPSGFELKVVCDVASAKPVDDCFYSLEEMCVDIISGGEIAERILLKAEQLVCRQREEACSLVDSAFIGLRPVMCDAPEPEFEAPQPPLT